MLARQARDPRRLQRRPPRRVPALREDPLPSLPRPRPGRPVHLLDDGGQGQGDRGQEARGGRPGAEEEGQGIPRPPAPYSVASRQTSKRQVLLEEAPVTPRDRPESQDFRELL